MATGINGIATIGELVSGKGLGVGGLSSPWDPNQCPTTADIVNYMEGVVSGSYQANQLVKYSDVTKSPPSTATYTLTIYTYYNNYYKIALFPNIGTPSVSYNSYYTFLHVVAPKTYMTTFLAGTPLRVNGLTANPEYVSIGNTYTIWGLLTPSSNWTKIATLTHVDGDKSQTV